MKKAYLLVADFDPAQEGNRLVGNLVDVKIYEVPPDNLNESLPLVSHEDHGGRTKEEAFHLAAEFALSNITIKEEPWPTSRE